MRLASHGAFRLLDRLIRAEHNSRVPGALILCLSVRFERIVVRLPQFSLFNGVKREFMICVLLLLCAAATTAARAQTFKAIHSFDGMDGEYDSTSVPIQGTDGNLYGVMPEGGANAFGTAYRMTPTGELTTIYNFCAQSGCADGQNPEGDLVQGTDGDFYGVTINGGAAGYGTAFKITSSGALTTLYNFCSRAECQDGAEPNGGLVLGSDGNFYGTTEGSSLRVRGGTIFKLNPNGLLETLYNFCLEGSCIQSLFPSGLIQGRDGNFYGTTQYGGDGAFCTVTGGCGQVFKISPQGDFTTLHAFCSESNCSDGLYPYAALVQASDGNFYGTTGQGGDSPVCGIPGGCGTIFRITSDGVLTTLHSFCSLEYCADGLSPQGSLIQATDGDLYGTSRQGGGELLDGTVFKITTQGKLTLLYRFDCPRVPCSGLYPYVGLVQDTDGTFYGVTNQGGIIGYGVVYDISTGLGPFVQTQTDSGAVDTTVNILGTNLTGATGVSFNGTAASFTVASSSLITATVPADASSGYVAVTTPSGVLTSNRPFQVVP
jgi:uncharacterized repeat protein (TIGR03803 family)